MAQKFLVSIESEVDRYQTVFRSLDSIFEDFSSQIYRLNPKKDYVLIKPNCIVTRKELATTHIDALRAVLDFLEPLWSGRVIIAEGAGLGNTLEAFKNLGFLDLKNIYSNLHFLDLNFAECVFVEAYDKNLKQIQIKIANTVAAAPFRLSLCLPKTHDSVIVTLSIKNMAVGAILKEDKSKIHQGPKAINKTLASLYHQTFPHIAVIDGWESMEGDGPVNGHKVDTRFAIASSNALAADTFCTERMGFNPLQIGYLNLLGVAKIASRIEAIGQDPDNFNFHFKLPPNYHNQQSWQ